MKHEHSNQANNEGNNQQSTGNSSKTKVWHYSVDLEEFVPSKCKVSLSVTDRVLQQWCLGRINHQSRGPPIGHLQGQRTVQREGLLATSTWGQGEVFLEGGGRGRYQPDRVRK
eukprot:5258151-Ditylum_brightwellii.AAC.1